MSHRAHEQSGANAADAWAWEADLVCTHDLQGRLLSVSAAAARALGYEVEELLAVPMRDLAAPEFRGQFQRYLTAIRRKGSAKGLVKVRTRGGESRVWEYHNVLRTDAHPPIVAGAARDVTERINNERALRASENRFAMAFHSSPIAMAITTLAEGQYVDVNEAFERQVGYARAEIYGRTSLELSIWPSPADRADMIERLLRHRTLRAQHAQFRTKSGRLISTLYSASLITLNNRQCVLAAIADITAQKEAEDALRESEAKFRLLAESMVSGIFIYGDDGRMAYFNPQFEALTGYSREELVSMTLRDVVHPASRDLVETRVRDRLKGSNPPVRTEFKIATKGGVERWVEVTATLIQFRGRAAILGMVLDVTERMESEAKLQELRERMIRVQDEERAHIARELHDNIGQHLALLDLQLTALQKTARVSAPALVEQLQSAGRLAEEIAAEAHQLSHRLHPSHLVYLGLATAVSSFCHEFGRQSGISIDFEPDQLPELSPAITTCLYRVVQEAIRNAERHSGSRRVRVDLTSRPNAIWLCVSDSGCGFDPHALDGRTGLGLVSMAERVRSVGGELAVRSRVDHGTRIEVSVPLPKESGSAAV